MLLVGKYYPPIEGGIENHFHALAQGLTPRYDVTALVFNRERSTRQETLDGVRVVRAASLGRLLSTEIAPSFLRWFLSLRDADVIHLHTPNPVGELACLAAPRSARLIITYHSDVIRQRLLGRINRILLHRLMRRADRIIVFTRRYMESSPVLRHYESKCAIIPHGVDLSELAATPAVERRAAELRACHGAPLILFVGRLVYYKGVDVLLRALPRVPEARLLVAGDGPMMGALTGLATELGLTQRVAFLGRVSQGDKLACYRAADMLVLPATHRSEAFGLVQVEALASALPIVCTDIDSGVPFVNQHEQTGLVVPPNDPAALARAIERLASDPPLRWRMGRAGRGRAEALFSSEVMIRDSLALYEQVLSEGGAVGSPREVVP